MRTDRTAMVVSCGVCGAVAFGGDARDEETREAGYATAAALWMEVRFVTPDEARAEMAKFGACACEEAHGAGLSEETPCSPVVATESEV